MATFKEEFKKQRALKGSGATFEWNGKTYSTDTADGKKASPAKPAARPTAPKSGAAQSGTAGKVAPKVAPKESMSGASRSTAGKVKPKVDMPARPTGGAKAKQIAKEGARSSNVASNVAVNKGKETTFERMKRALTTKGGLSKFKG